MFFNWFRYSARSRYSNGTSPVRVILMAMVVMGMCWAFWANSERYTSKFTATGRFHDEPGAFSEEQKKEILDIIGRFDKNIQVKLQVHVQNHIFTSPDAVAGEVIFGIAPEQKQMVLFMPALWRNAVGDGFAHQLRSEIMEPSFENDTWREATIRALLLMERRFETLVR